jgi:starch-binding outer membrane protein, SusD/RagB family
MKRIHYKFLWLVALVVAIASCKKELEVDPRQSIRIEDALGSRDNINAAITGIYGRLKNLRVYGRDLIALPEALADNGFVTQKSGRLINETTNVQNAHFTAGFYQQSYFGIAEINLALAAIPTAQGTPAITAAERDNWEGQLKFLRGLFLFNLVRVYGYDPGVGVPGQDRGGIPISLSTPTVVAEAVKVLGPRVSVDSIYNVIYRDLTQANLQLANSASASVFPQFATKVAVQGLFSRVALTRKDYTNCKRWADSAINFAGGRLVNSGSVVNSWRNPVHPESLFEIRFANQAENNGVNESPQTTFTTLLVPGNPGVVGGFGDLVPTPVLRTELGIAGAFGPATITSRTDDARNLLYEVGSPARGTAYVECTKFIGKNGFPNLDNLPVIRIPEVYLNRAEAMATPGSPVFDETAARNDLIRIKQNRYTNYAVSQQTFDNGLTGSALFEEILRQRRLELAFEGSRFFDLKRLGRDIVKAQSANLAYTDFRILAPFPIRETDLNPLLLQNFGY